MTPTQTITPHKTRVYLAGAGDFKGGRGTVIGVEECPAHGAAFCIVRMDSGERDQRVLVDVLNLGIRCGFVEDEEVPHGG